MESSGAVARGISEIVLVVRDVRAAAAFYRDVVGLAPRTPESDDWAWFRTGPGERPPLLAVTRGPLLFEEHSPRPAGGRWGPVHFALEVPRTELEAAAERVRSHGVPVFGPQRFEWTKSVSYYFYDPDDNLVEW